jgi:muramoyltetrapeptide carboxypeptidase
MDPVLVRREKWIKDSAGEAAMGLNLRKPNRLRRGDVIGLVAPASPPLCWHRVEVGVRYLEGLGYHVKMGRHANARHGYLAGTDAQRAEDLNAMLRDRQVRAIFSLRGGYGSPRLLPWVDYAAARRDPKIVVGSSDLTGLQLALWRRAGLLTFSGPMLATDFGGELDPYTEEQFWGLVTSSRARGELRQSDGQVLTMLRPGRVEGRLLGGNLSLVISSLGTSYSPQYAGALLALEEVGEPLYRVDRMFTQLRNAGVLRRVGGLVLGQFTDCRLGDSSRPSLTQEQILEEVTQWVGGPVLGGLQYGHLPAKLTLPIGARARLDAGRGGW